MDAGGRLGQSVGAILCELAGLAGGMQAGADGEFPHEVRDAAADARACVRAVAVSAGASPASEASPLFPSAADRARQDDLLTRALADAQVRIARGGVAPTTDRDAARAALRGFDFATPRPLDALLPWTLAQMEHGVTHMTHPRYLGLFNPAPTFPAQLADRIVSAFNPQLASATTSPAAVEIEAHTIRAVALRAGLPEAATGHFTSGGAEANCTALLCALTRAEPGFATDGARAFRGLPVFYASAECHLAWLKIAHQAGIGRSGLRLVGTDGTGRMDAAALQAAIAADQAAGCVPVMVVATAGTTAGGMVDPLAASAEIARGCQAWFHVDAAWGGAAIASDRLRGLLRGIDQADSVTIDAHKWFATTMGCGMFLTAHPAALSATFQATASFMPSNALDVDPYVTSAQWSRRFLGLRLFLSLAAAGWAGYAAHVERAVALTERLRDDLAARGWRIANDPSLAVLCAQPPPGAPPGAPPVREVVRRVLASGQAWLSVARFEGQEVVRACVTHGETGPEDIRVVADALHLAAQ